MDIFLIVILLIIVAVIGYILSRPFAHPQALQDVQFTTNDNSIRYRTLLSEIKMLEAQCAQAEIPDEVCEQLEDKKRQAAELLRTIKPSLKDEGPLPPPKPASAQLDTQPERDLAQNGSYICPQCGSQVIASDKFCAHCGHRLQP